MDPFDDDDDDYIFDAVDKIVAEHEARKAATQQQQSQGLSPLVDRQTQQPRQNGAPPRPGQLFPSQQVPQPFPNQVPPRPPFPAAPAPRPPPTNPAPSVPPVGRVSQAAAQLRAGAAPPGDVSMPPANAGPSARPPEEFQQRLDQLEGTNKLLRTNLESVEREKLALKQKLQQLESRGAPAQSASMAEMQRQMEQLRQQLLFKDQELDEAKKRVAAAGEASGAAAARRPAPASPGSKKPGESAGTSRVKRKANGAETVVENEAQVQLKPLFLSPFGVPGIGGGGSGGAASGVESSAAVIARLWAACPTAMGALLARDGSLELSAAGTAATSAYMASFLLELSRLRAQFAADIPRVAVGVTSTIVLLGTLASYVGRVCMQAGAGSSDDSSEPLAGAQREYVFNLASAALTVMQHLIIEDPLCRRAALASCGNEASKTPEQRTLQGLVSSGRVTFAAPIAGATAAAGEMFKEFLSGADCIDSNTAHEASMQHVVSLLSRLPLGSKAPAGEAAVAAAALPQGLLALCISAALLPGEQHPALLASIAGLANSLVNAASPGSNRSIFLPLLSSGAMLSLLKSPPPYRISAVLLLYALLEDAKISEAFNSSAGAARDAPQAAVEKTPGKESSSKNPPPASATERGGGGGGSASKAASSKEKNWAAEVMRALLECLRIVRGDSNAAVAAEAPISPRQNGDGAQHDDTALARAAFSVFALLLEKKCSAVLQKLLPGDEAMPRRISIGGTTAGDGAGGAGISKVHKRVSGDGKSDASDAGNTPGSLPVRLILLAEEAVKYHGEDDLVALLQNSRWVESAEPAAAASQATWQRRIRLAQESLTLLRGLLISGSPLANATMEELLSSSAVTQRMLAATTRMSRIESPPSDGPNSTLEGQVSLFINLPIAPWAYSVGTSSNAANLAPVSAAERRAGLPCCSANDVSHLARGIKHRIVYSLRN